MGDLKRLPGARLSPEVVLHQMLEKKSRIKAVALVVTWDDDTLDVDWSAMPVSMLALNALMLTDTAKEVAKGRYGVTVPPERKP